MADSRGRRMLQQLRDQKLLECLDTPLPKYESTKGTSAKERDSFFQGNTSSPMSVVEVAVPEQWENTTNEIHKRSSRRFANVGLSNESFIYKQNLDKDSLDTVLKAVETDEKCESSESNNFVLAKGVPNSPTAESENQTLLPIPLQQLVHKYEGSLTQYTLSICNNFISKNMFPISSPTETVCDVEMSDHGLKFQSGSKTPHLELLEPSLHMQQESSPLSYLLPSSSPMYDSDRDPAYHPDSSDYLTEEENETFGTLQANVQAVDEDECINEDLNGLKGSENQHTTPIVDEDAVDNDIPNVGATLETAPIPNRPALKRIRQKDFCFYCENSVLNFARHLMTAHTYEMEVENIMSLSPNSAERKALIAGLRKKGNYIQNSREGCQKAVRRSVLPSTIQTPCPYCLGYYSKNLLWKHKHKCRDGKNKPLTTLGDSQTLLVGKLDVDSQLKTKVFPHMKPDNISLAAKKDHLICAFGARYLKIYKQKHFVHTTSVKMRELARLLEEVKLIQPTIKNMFDALRPVNYDALVRATKKITRYDEEKETFGAPTLAMNISKSLKDCCGIAITETLKNKFNHNSFSSSEIVEEFKTMIQLIKCNWQYDVSGEASADLNMKKLNKVTIIPLASDLRVFKDYLSRIGTEASEKLKNNPNDERSYRYLLEVVYCRVLVLNRRRPGELQRLPLDTYLNINKSQASYEEFNEIISPSEKVLMNTFKRVMIRGKRGRGVSVLFAPDVTKHIELLLKSRPLMFQTTQNPYLFGLPNLTTPLIGYKVLEKHAKVSGAKNPAAITATRLRKHLATITQIFSMGPGDIEQLTMFMGHTEQVHRSVYRLPDDVYQTAKLGKLLLAMEDGSAGKYKGKTLSEINLNMEEDLLDPEDKDEDECFDFNFDDLNTPSTSQEHKVKVNKQKISTKKRTLVAWTLQQKQLVLEHFKRHINDAKPPKRQECENLMSLHPGVFDNKTWVKIKVFVQNQYVKKNNNGVSFTAQNVFVFFFS